LIEPVNKNKTSERVAKVFLMFIVGASKFGYSRREERKAYIPSNMKDARILVPVRCKEFCTFAKQAQAVAPGWEIAGVGNEGTLTTVFKCPKSASQG
jgi:hypothetical protein